MNRTFACSDLHGQLYLWNEIKKYIDKTDTLYFLGDAIDRGPSGIYIMEDLLSMSNVIYLKGNHEKLMTDAIPFLHMGYHGTAVLTWFRNGGEQTWNYLFKNYSKEEILYLAEKIDNLPFLAVYENKNGKLISLSHSGYFHYADNVPPDEEDAIWNRAHFYSSWQGQENEIMIHGHTPVEFMDRNNPKKIFTYCENHKIDIDLGCFFTGTAALLDLDTLEPIYFSKPE